MARRTADDKVSKERGERGHATHLAHELELRVTPMQRRPQLVANLRDEVQLGFIRFECSLAKKRADDNGSH